MRFAPKRSDSQPDSGITAACASMYPVMTHCSRPMSVSRTRPSVGKATFTTVLSRITMKVPRMIAMRGTRTEVITWLRQSAGPKYCRPDGGFWACPYGQLTLAPRPSAGVHVLAQAADTLLPSGAAVDALAADLCGRLDRAVKCVFFLCRRGCARARRSEKPDPAPRNQRVRTAKPLSVQQRTSDGRT